MRPLPGCLSGIVIWEQPQKKFTNSININFFYRRTKTFRDIESLTYIYVVGELPWWLSSKEFTCIAEDAGNMGLIPGSGRSPGGGNSNLLKYSCHENPMNREAWATIHRVAICYLNSLCVCVCVCARVCALSRLLVSLAPPAFASRLFTTAPPGKPRWHKYFYLIREKAH